MLIGISLINICIHTIFKNIPLFILGMHISYSYSYSYDSRLYTPMTHTCCECFQKKEGMPMEFGVRQNNMGQKIFCELLYFD